MSALLADVVERVTRAVEAYDPEHPPLMDDYPYAPFIVSALYVATVFGYPPVRAWLEKTFKVKLVWELRTALQLWNLFLAIFSAICFALWVFYFTVAMGGASFHKAICMPKYEMYNVYKGAGVLGVVFMWSKWFELIDTAFLLLRGKPVIFLHWYHHFTVLMYTWYAQANRVGFGHYFGVVNAFVHMLMYYYYFRAAQGKRLWWARYLTQLQLVQMLAGIFVTASWYYLHISGADCPLAPTTPTRLLFVSIAMYGSYLYLFLRLYLGKYNRDGASKSKEE